MLTVSAYNAVEGIFLWGLVATIIMTTIMQGSLGMGFSRLSLPFLVGTFFTSNRRWASVIGILCYLGGGWFFATLYFILFLRIGEANAWLGALIGLVHGVFLLVVILPLLPEVHPRLASEYDGPSEGQRLEPPGFMGLNYGYRTPLVTLVAHTAYGALLGALFSLP